LQHLYATYTQHGLVNIAKKKRELKSSQINFFERIFIMKSENGRSMVEMLGVLAIIGVLSVGAIAGYSKAMMKYKLNQHAQAVNMLINNILQLKGQLQYEPNKTTYYHTLLHKMNLLPDGIIYDKNSNLRDSWFKNKIFIYYNNSKWTTSDGTETQNNFGAIGFHFAPSSGGAEVCRNIVIAARENAANLWELETFNSDSDNLSSGKYIGNLYGDSYCNATIPCLRDLDLNKIQNLCNACDGTACVLYALWK
jgi:type II secretory pathway pseudopilin PulG